MVSVIAPAPVATAAFSQRLGVVTHVPHWIIDGRVQAYEPYVRELEVWAKLFTTVDVCAPRGEGPASSHLAAYRAANIRWRPVRYTMATGRWMAVRRAGQIPRLAVGLARVLRANDLVLLRSPGHPAALGRVLARLTGTPTITKWAGLFERFEGERLPSRIERFLVRIGNAVTLVYGPAELGNLVPFIPALLSEAELDEACRLSRDRVWRPPWHLLAVGRLTAVKGFDLAIAGLGELYARRPQLWWDLTLVGDGPERERLKFLAGEAGIAQRVRFVEALPFAAVQKYYGRSHVVIMPGVKEGWPKVIAEAWAHGAVPVAAEAGLVPWILSDRDAGAVFRADPSALADTLSDLLLDPARLEAMGAGGPARSRSLSLESFERRVEEVLRTRMRLV